MIYFNSMEKITSSDTFEHNRTSLIYTNSDGTVIADLTGCKGSHITNIYEAVSALKVLYEGSRFEAAGDLLNIAFELAIKSEQTSEEFRRALTELYGIAGDISAELGNAQEALDYYKSFQCLKMQLKCNLFRNSTHSDTIKLYQFRRFTNYTLANLLNREVTLSSPKIMNDIFDSPIYQWLNSPSYGATALHHKHLAPFKESFDYYRIACFCEDPAEDLYAIKNNLMWAHYADEHRGFCVEYQFSSDDFRRDEFEITSASRLFRMKYWDPQKDKTIGFRNLRTDKSLSASDAFLTKHKDWSYENEVRLLQYNPQDGALHIQYKLSEKTVITAIYFGYRCSDTDIRIIKRLMAGRNIKFYKMKIDFSNIYNLTYDEV